jgi:hypothetical protein
MKAIIFLFFTFFIILNRMLFSKITSYSKTIIKKRYNYDIEQFTSKRKRSWSLISLLQEYFF